MIVDVQEKLVPAIRDVAELVKSVRFLQSAASTLSIPVFISEQYPEGLGSTLQEILSGSENAVVVSKTRFSAANEFQSNTASSQIDQRRNQVVVVGMESHICVLQTTAELLNLGYEVFVVEDAVNSRHAVDHANAIRRMSELGATVCVAESVVFEWCEESGSNEFRDLSKLVRNRSARRSNES